MKLQLGGVPKNSDETGTAVIYLMAGILAIYAGVKKIRNSN
jgi:hypothetical protein